MSFLRMLAPLDLPQRARHDGAAPTDPAGSTGDTPLLKAAARGQLDCCQLLWERGAQGAVRQANARGEFPLLAACQNRHVGVCAWLVEHGAAEDVRRRTARGVCPLHAVVQSAGPRAPPELLAVLDFLVENGAGDDTWIPSDDGRARTPLWTSCEQGNLRLCKWLYAHGASQTVRTPDRHRRSPMFAACQGGHVRVAQWLFDHGAAEDIAAPDARGVTPMHSPGSQRGFPTFKWLLRVGGPALLGPNPGQSRPVRVAVIRTSLIKWLLEELALHDCFLGSVLFGMMRKRSGSHHLWKLGGGGVAVQQRKLIAQFLGVALGHHHANLADALRIFALSAHPDAGTLHGL